MATNEQWHNSVTASLGGAENYGRGVWPNPWIASHPEFLRRISSGALRDKITHKIHSIFEPRFITSVETCELLEALIAMTGAMQVLELGTHTGFGALHMLRAIVGKQGAKLTCVEARPTHDKEFFAQPEIAKHFEFIQGWTPDALRAVSGRQFDFVFVDSSHDLEHTQKEWAALQPITHAGTMFTWHDMPEWQSPDNRTKPPVRLWLEQQIADGKMRGLVLPSPEQLDCREQFGSSYDGRLNPGLAVTIRT